MFPTVREILALDSVRHGLPRVLAGDAALDRPVRWVHVAEVPDIATLLRGGELVLSTGIGLPPADTALAAFVDALAEVGAAGLVIELGRGRFATSLPRAMVQAAARHSLPLIELRRTVRFVRITEAVHALIVDAQLTELRATEEIHQRFTELSVEGASPSDVVHQAAVLSGCPVVLENLSRQVLAYDTAGDRADLLLDNWEQHSRRLQPTSRTAFVSGWLVTTVGARGQDWGRLLLRWPGPSSPPSRLSILLERAASTLALGRLLRRDAEGLERQIHRTLLTALLDHTRPVDEVALRARALGVTLDRRHLIGVVVRFRPDAPVASPASHDDPGGPRSASRSSPTSRESGGSRPASRGPSGGSVSASRDSSGGSRSASRDPTGAGGPAPRVPTSGGRSPAREMSDFPDSGQERLRDLAEAVSDALRDSGISGLTSPIDDATVGALLAVASAADEDRALTAFVDALARTRGNALEVIIAAGTGAPTLREARRSLTEARQVADAARHDHRAVPFFRLPDVGLAGLLHLLRDEPRLQTFVERELGPLLTHDAAHPRDQLLGTLRLYLEHGRNKSAAASAAHLSRPAFYDRLTRISRLLSADLDSVDTCLSLHVALLALPALRER
ncbi:PucR family transcriptional regulator ligand-binding domain-containing protein [Catenuloplanes japonicus]|uniref:PucR family transcriptional regulator ligand-binding domain-containing protein n=1 Tax=Catenuloplanes japonicus TaxID=33876 RepID=UPI000527D473|nr:PucR family transcriptional regulator ligand-binding domain-containing protein [Catenuloplanes japonicus]